MTHADHATAPPHALHREVVGTIGLLADAEDFTAMRRYATFAFDDHHGYLRQVEALLSARAAEGRHTTVALFDPREYEAYCADTGLEPDTPASRTRFTAELAASGTTLPYEGQPLAELVPDLLTAALRYATWEYATTVLATIGACASCGEDIGWASYTRACELLVRVLDSAGPGTHQLVCSAATGAGTLLAALRVKSGAVRGVDETEAQEFTTLLATGIATGAPGGLVVRTSGRKAHDKVYGWRLRGWSLKPLTAAEVFDVYCTDVDSGDLVSPESRVDYSPPPDLGEEVPPAGHTH
jgi:hypothetical protein